MTEIPNLKHNEGEAQVATAKSVGDMLRAWRRERDLRVEDIAREMKISSLYVSAMEEGNYEAFSARVYALGFLRHFMRQFDIVDEKGELIRQFNAEWEAYNGDRQLGNPLAARHTSLAFQFILTPRRLFGAVGGIALLFFFILLIWQVSGFTGKPNFALAEPGEGAVLDTPIVRVHGSTDKESQLTVNGREIRMDGFGSFDEKIELIPGLNTLDFLVQNRFGKITQATRHVVVR